MEDHNTRIIVFGWMRPKREGDVVEDPDAAEGLAATAKIDVDVLGR